MNSLRLLVPMEQSAGFGERTFPIYDKMGK